MRTVRFPIGTSVKVLSKCSLNGRTGEVVEHPDFPWRDCCRVRFDLVPGKVKGEIVPITELRVIKLSDRPADALAPQKRQLALFEVAA